MIDRYHVASFLRVLSAAAFVVLALAFFWRPLAEALSPWLGGVAERIGLPGRTAAAGFHVQLTSEPSGATVRVNGAVRGRTPLIANVACKEGEAVELVVEKAGFSSRRRAVPCREGEQLIARAQLER